MDPQEAGPKLRGHVLQPEVINDAYGPEPDFGGASRLAGRKAPMRSCVRLRMRSGHGKVIRHRPRLAMQPTPGWPRT
jgi:hypothetical protein